MVRVRILVLPLVLKDRAGEQWGRPRAQRQEGLPQRRRRVMREPRRRRWSELAAVGLERDGVFISVSVYANR